MSKVDIDELVRWRDKCEALAASLQRKVRHCDEITEERDEARAEADYLRRDVECLQLGLTVSNEAYRAGYKAGNLASEAYRRGAEAMREACAHEASVCANHRGEKLADILSALPIPEEP